MEGNDKILFLVFFLETKTIIDSSQRKSQESFINQQNVVQASFNLIVIATFQLSLLSAFQTKPPTTVFLIWPFYDLAAVKSRFKLKQRQAADNEAFH